MKYIRNTLVDIVLIGAVASLLIYVAFLVVSWFAELRHSVALY